MTTLIRRFACSLFALATVSCGTVLVPEELAVRSPERVATRVALHNVNHGVCDFPVQLDRSGLSGDRIPRPVGNELLAGFDNFMLRGADPFPCHRQRSQEYIGGAFFNLDDVRGTVIDRASLWLERRATALPWAIGGSGAMCLVASARATQPWTGGYLSGPAGTTIAATPFTRRSPGNRIVGGVQFDSGVTFLRLDVTDIVQGWASGRPNHGFVIHQEEPDGSTVGANDRSCTSNFAPSLEMSIRRFVRASP